MSSLSHAQVADENKKVSTVDKNPEFQKYKSNKVQLSLGEKLISKEIANVAKEDVEETVRLIESAENDQVYEVYLREALEQYYSDTNANRNNIDAIKKLLDKRADSMIKNFDIAAEERSKEGELDYSTDSVIVSFDSDAGDEYIKDFLDEYSSGHEVLFDGTIDINEELPEEQLADLRARSEQVEDNKFKKIYKVDLRLDHSTSLAIEEFSEEVAVESVERDYQECSNEESDDPHVGRQYYLDTVNVGDAYEVYWNGHGEQWIAVLDDGVDMNHEDLRANLLLNYSYDVYEDELLKNCSVQYTDSHGTMVTSVIAAVAGNNKGIMGVASLFAENCNKVMMVKITDAEGETHTSAFIEGIEYAVENGASVINISWSSSGTNDSYQEIINVATQYGVTVVASAGNYGAEGNPTRYPAAYDNVISVAAVDSNNVRASFSNYGPTVDYAAPGVNIYTTTVGNLYTYINGTSFSAPIVAAGVAMLKEFTNNPTTTRIQNRLNHTATVLSDTTLGAGVVNIGLALEYARYLVFKDYVPIISKVKNNADGTATVRAKISANNQFMPTGFAIYRSATENGTYKKVKELDYDASFLVGNWDVIEWKDTGVTAGKTYYYKVRCYAKYGTGVRYTEYSDIVSVKVTQ